MKVSQFPIISIKNKKLIEQAQNVGCFHCCKIFDSKDIKDFTDNESTAICPLCGVDAIIPDNCGVIISEEILKKAKEFWLN